MNKVTLIFKEILNSDDLLEETITHIISMMKIVRVVDYKKLQNKTIIFEGAQGLLLDQDYGYFPHVTRSNCGMRNMIDILDKVPGCSVDYDDITVNYVTRAYTTRHGAGPLDREDDHMRDRHNIVDETNVTNDWQGSLRFAPLNLDLFNSVTDKDFLNYAPRTAKKQTVVTCLDQLRGETTWIDNGLKRFMSADVVRERAHEKFDFGSFGPTREDVVDFSEKG